ncbi:hypothetical protein FKX85_18775 [Echinicola soli]|uniref:Outer membrane protein beta-barrel domain-containing protein n=1 Tax=Echinicola soli TaxID=2591634 RepID=A0A514CMJ2_9BACT|nr:hypothetical protein [Echinicola soli]QDH80977.1 hypothetical protein FKX85_18775 [Echinicola soli]
MIKKSIVIIVLIFCSGHIYGQNRWISNVEIDFVFPQKKEYTYFDGRKNNDVKLKDHGFLLKSFGIQGDYSYLLFKKFSIGALGGFQTLSNPDYVMLKLGGIFRYYFVDPDNVYVYLLSNYNFTLDQEKFKNGGNVRIGLGFPVLKRSGFNINANIFAENNVLSLRGARPLLGFVDEEPNSLEVSSFGISFGVKF